MPFHYFCPRPILWEKEKHERLRPAVAFDESRRCKRERGNEICKYNLQADFRKHPTQCHEVTADRQTENSARMVLERPEP